MKVSKTKYTRKQSPTNQQKHLKQNQNVQTTYPSDRGRLDKTEKGYFGSEAQFLGCN